jgi:hypothetical protein
MTNGTLYARTHRNTYYWQHKLSGLCVDCTKPSLPDNIRCRKHRNKENRRRRKVPSGARKEKED